MTLVVLSKIGTQYNSLYITGFKLIDYLNSYNSLSTCTDEKGALGSDSSDCVLNELNTSGYQEKIDKEVDKALELFELRVE